MRKFKLSEEQNRKLETICAIVIIAFALVSYAFTSLFPKKIDNTSYNIVIFVGDNEITEANGEKIDINKDMTFMIGDKDSDYNIIEIKDKKVRCVESNCPDKICINHGILRDDIDNDIIICAPHKMTIYYEKKSGF